MTPRVGLYLYASCSAEDYGRIVHVGQDANGKPVIDIELFHPSDLVDCDDDESSGSENPLTWLELSPGATLTLRDVHFKLSDVYDNLIVCNTPGNNCFRCTKLFSMEEKSFDERCREDS